MAFATADDLASFLQTTFTADQQATAELLLDLATAAVQAATGQTISEVAGDTVTVAVPDGYELELPQLPATEPTQVMVGGEVVTDWSFDGVGTLYRPGGWRAYNTLTGALERVSITYTHGYATIPDDIRRVCLQAAARAFRNPEGLRSETIGAESYTYATETVQAVDLTPDEERAVRRSLRTARVGSVVLR